MINATFGEKLHLKYSKNTNTRTHMPVGKEVLAIEFAKTLNEITYPAILHVSCATELYEPVSLQFYRITYLIIDLNECDFY